MRLFFDRLVDGITVCEVDQPALNPCCVDRFDTAVAVNVAEYQLGSVGRDHLDNDALNHGCVNDIDLTALIGVAE